MTTNAPQSPPEATADSLHQQLGSQLPHTILAALDTHDDFVLHSAIHLAQQCHSELILLHVVDELSVIAYCNPCTGWPLMTDYLRDEARKLLANSLAQVPDGIHAQTLFREGNPAHEISAAASQYHADLVILGQHHHSLLHRLFVQSTANAALHHLPTPVALISDNQPPTIHHLPSPTD